ncbi:PREDICTED: protein Simiate [Dufourea novaeangliae]|uniref:protein Simiate n=1 Tax=Dufourea novaeangliae TaxID=178035 RepID=UPI0007678FBF|nr:PREDICTED: protein Simiate [Dufourea novaeangliae]
MSANSGNEPIPKKVRSNNVDTDYCNEHEKLNKNNIEKDPEYQENMKLTDNEDEEEISLPKNDEDDHLCSFPPDDDVADMLDEVQYDGSFPTITDRYLTAYYKLDVQSSADDICILMHSNRICMLTLAPSHTILQSDKEITNVNFRVSEKLDRVLNKVSGKSKHGAQPLQANSNICIITTSNGKTYTIKCCIIGKLVEVNETLLENPKLLLEPPHKGGYLAIVLPNIKLLDKMKNSLLTQEEYDLKMLERQSTINHLDISIQNDSKTVDNNSQLHSNENDITLSIAS